MCISVKWWCIQYINLASDDCFIVEIQICTLDSVRLEERSLVWRHPGNFEGILPAEESIVVPDAFFNVFNLHWLCRSDDISSHANACSHAENSAHFSSTVLRVMSSASIWPRAEFEQINCRAWGEVANDARNIEFELAKLFLGLLWKTHTEITPHSRSQSPAIVIAFKSNRNTSEGNLTGREQQIYIRVNESTLCNSNRSLA